eukprot:gene10639-biopygen4242
MSWAAGTRFCENILRGKFCGERSHGEKAQICGERSRGAILRVVFAELITSRPMIGDFPTVPLTPHPPRLRRPPPPLATLTTSHAFAAITVALHTIRYPCTLARSRILPRASHLQQLRPDVSDFLAELTRRSAKMLHVFRTNVYAAASGRCCRRERGRRATLCSSLEYAVFLRPRAAVRGASGRAASKRGREGHRRW